MASSTGKILLLLDMNGTMCYRHEVPVAGVEETLYQRRRYWYERRGIREFVRRLSESGHFHLCVYTSMMAHNALDGLHKLLEKDFDLIKHVFDRSCSPIDPDGANEWDTIRDMNKVWPKLGGVYDHSNTIMLDNEARKFRDIPDNGIEVPEYGAEHVRARVSNTLDALLSYLLALGEASPSDVREYMKSNPFSPDTLAAKVESDVSELTEKLGSLRVHNALANVPRSGTAHVRCIDGSLVTLCDVENKLTLRVTMRDGLRLDAKMNVGRLIELAGEKSVELVVDNVRHQGNTKHVE